MVEINDRRTQEQRVTHIFLAVVTDRFMSGWGHAGDGNSYAGWAFTSLDEARDKVWLLQHHTNYQRARIIVCRPGARYRPGKGCAHLSIYVTDSNNVQF